MNYKKHLILGILIFFVFLLFTENLRIEHMIFGFVVSFIGSLLPDIDTKKSRIHKTVVLFLGMSLFTGLFITLYKSLEFAYAMLFSLIISFALVIILIYTLPEHRKGLHTIRAAIVFSAFIWFCSYLAFSDVYIVNALAILAFMTYFGHLALDNSLKL